MKMVEPVETEVECKTCGRRKRRDCDGQGWLEALGPYRDGSYISSRPCPSENPFAGD
jgi:hypothetical protein